MLKSWPLCNSAEPNFADSFGWSRREQLYCFARQRGAKWACASKIVSFQPVRIWWGVLYQCFKGRVAVRMGCMQSPQAFNLTLDGLLMSFFGSFSLASGGLLPVAASPPFPDCCSVAQSCPTLCDPMVCSTPGFPVRHRLLELAQIHVLWVVMWPNHLVHCHLLRLLPSVLPRIRVFSSESALHIRWPKMYGASASALVLPMNIQDWFPLGLTASPSIGHEVTGLDAIILVFLNDLQWLESALWDSGKVMEVEVYSLHTRKGDRKRPAKPRISWSQEKLEEARKDFPLEPHCH